MYERSTGPCESKPKKTGAVKKESLFSSLFRSRRNTSTFEEVKKNEEKEEEVPCPSNSHQEEEITSPLEEACDNVVPLMEEQPHASTVGATNTFEEGTLVALQEVPNAHQEQLGCIALCNMETIKKESNCHSHEPLLDCTSHWRLGFEDLKIDVDILE